MLKLVLRKVLGFKTLIITSASPLVEHPRYCEGIADFGHETVYLAVGPLCQVVRRHTKKTNRLGFLFP
jgi:hypothetical protein